MAGSEIACLSRLAGMRHIAIFTGIDHPVAAGGPDGTIRAETIAHCAVLGGIGAGMSQFALLGPVQKAVTAHIPYFPPHNDT